MRLYKAFQNLILRLSYPSEATIKECKPKFQRINLKYEHDITNHIVSDINKFVLAKLIMNKKIKSHDPAIHFYKNAIRMG